MEDWLRIASDIESNYNKYDAFVVLHGEEAIICPVFSLQLVRYRYHGIHGLSFELSL